MKTALATFGMVVLFAVLFVVFVVGPTVGYYKLLPWFYGQQFKAVRQSQPYVTTRQTSLVQFYAAWKKLEADKAKYPENVASIAGQQEAIVAQMRQQAALLQPEDVPTQVRAFLETH